MGDSPETWMVRQWLEFRYRNHFFFTRVPVAHVQSVLGAWRTQWIVMSSIAS